MWCSHALTNSSEFRHAKQGKQRLKHTEISCFWIKIIWYLVSINNKYPQFHVLTKHIRYTLYGKIFSQIGQIWGKLLKFEKAFETHIFYPMCLKKYQIFWKFSKWNNFRGEIKIGRESIDKTSTFFPWDYIPTIYSWTPVDQRKMFETHIFNFCTNVRFKH